MELWLRQKAEETASTEHQAFPRRALHLPVFCLRLYPMASVFRSLTSTAGVSSWAVCLCVSRVSPQLLRSWLPCGQPSPEPSMVQNLRSETVSCGTAVKQACHYHVSSLRKKLAFLRAK